MRPVSCEPTDYTMILPAEYLPCNALQYISVMGTRSTALYIAMLVFVFSVVAALPFISVDISVHAPGLIRPSQERTEVKAMVAGQIDSIYCNEGAAVVKDHVFIRLKDNNSLPKKILNRFDLMQHRQFIHDLQLLTGKDANLEQSVNRLQSPLYRQQGYRYLNQLAEQEAILKKAKKELEMNRFLEQEKVIASKELFDKAVENERLQAVYHSMVSEQCAKWQQELSRYCLERSQLQAQQQQLDAENKLFNITAPVSGTIQGLTARYSGSAIQAGEAICTISPETGLVAECYVTTRDAGFIRPGQPATFRIDAFNYNYFGLLTGSVASIDNDFTVINNEPAFKVRCVFNRTQLHLKNGYTGHLKKGLTLQANFIIANRTLWQLLFDNINDWINPSADKSLKL